MKKILFYTNQFFGQIGGEEFAYTEPFVEEGCKGPAVGLQAAIPDGEIVASIVCGDNYFAENIDKCKDFIRAQVEKYQPDLFIAGPAFNAGRFGIACGESCKLVQEELGIPAITGMYEENPAVDMFKAARSCGAKRLVCPRKKATSPWASGSTCSTRRTAPSAPSRCSSRS